MGLQIEKFVCSIQKCLNSFGTILLALINSSITSKLLMLDFNKKKLLIQIGCFIFSQPLHFWLLYFCKVSSTCCLLDKNHHLTLSCAYTLFCYSNYPKCVSTSTCLLLMCREDDELVKRFLSRQNNREYQERYANRKDLPAFNKLEEILKSVSYINIFSCMM